MGEFLNTILRQTLPHVYNYGSHGQNMFDFASDLKKGDAAVFITYSRYSRLMYLTAEMVHKQGASIILLTDKPTCETAKFADVVLTARGDSSEFYNSYVAGMFAAEMLCAYICRETNYSNQELLERIDEYTSRLGIFKKRERRISIRGFPASFYMLLSLPRSPGSPGSRIQYVQ